MKQMRLRIFIVALASSPGAVFRALAEAVETGISAEIDNIGMYARFLGQDLPGEVRDLTCTHLMKASENHLRDFRNALDRYQ